MDINAAGDQGRQLKLIGGAGNDILRGGGAYDLLT